MEHDHVDDILLQWQRERPDLDASPMGVIGRISRAALLLGRSLEAVFARFGLNSGEFDVLAALRRSGSPFRLTPTALSTELMMSSGGMTNRLDRLERAGLIVRVPDPADRRSTLIELTAQGRALVDEAVAAHLANEHRLLAGFAPEERAQLAQLLRTLLHALETTPLNASDDPG